MVNREWMRVYCNGIYAVCLTSSLGQLCGFKSRRRIVATKTFESGEKYFLELLNACPKSYFYLRLLFFS